MGAGPPACSLESSHGEPRLSFLHGPLSCWSWQACSLESKHARDQLRGRRCGAIPWCAHLARVCRLCRRALALRRRCGSPVSDTDRLSDTYRLSGEELAGRAPAAGRVRCLIIRLHAMALHPAACNSFSDDNTAACNSFSDCSTHRPHANRSLMTLRPAACKSLRG